MAVVIVVTAAFAVAAVLLLLLPVAVIFVFVAFYPREALSRPFLCLIFDACASDLLPIEFLCACSRRCLFENNDKKHCTTTSSPTSFTAVSEDLSEAKVSQKGIY